MYLDTGAMYRACGLKALRLGIDTKDCEKVTEMLPLLDVKVEYKDGKQHTILDGEDVSQKIRENAVSMAASDISAHPAVRVKMVEMQREIASQMSCVLDGRDIGSTVLPNAKFKFFITADINVRAKRRYNDVKDEATFEEVLKEMKKRDEDDINREEGALIPAENAKIIDTSEKTIEQTTNLCYDIVNGKLS